MEKKCFKLKPKINLTNFSFNMDIIRAFRVKKNKIQGLIFLEQSMRL